jgi:hypothetical protein
MPSLIKRTEAVTDVGRRQSLGYVSASARSKNYANATRCSTCEVHPLHDAAPLVKAKSLWYAANYSACLRVLEEQPPSIGHFMVAA